MVDGMALDPSLLREAERARDELIALQHDAERTQVSYQHAIRQLHAAGGSMREIAGALGLSYQRVHQIVDVSTGKGAVKPSGTEGECAFCGEVRRAIAGPGLLICDRCVDRAAEVIAEGGECGELVAVQRDRPKARCSFCGKPRGRVDAMVGAPQRPGVGRHVKGDREPGVRICGDCLTLSGEILAEGAAPAWR
jgi:hypothetical protein